MRLGKYRAEGLKHTRRKGVILAFPRVGMADEEEHITNEQATKRVNSGCEIPTYSEFQSDVSRDIKDIILSGIGRLLDGCKVSMNICAYHSLDFATSDIPYALLLVIEFPFSFHRKTPPEGFVSIGSPICLLYIFAR